MKVRFWTSDKPRERIVGEAFLTGAKRHGDETEIRALGQPATDDCDVAVMIGVKSRELWRAHQRMGVQLVYLDKGYDRHDRGDGSRVWEYWRCAVNNHHPTAKFKADYPTDRLDAFGWKFKPWRTTGKHILIAGSSEKYHAFYDLKDPTDWSMKLVKQLRSVTQMEIVYRPKPSWKNAVPIEGTRFSKDEGIDDALRDCYCMITHGSNACFEAMLAGIPSIIIGDAVMKPISSTEVSDIHKLRLASDKERRALLAFLAYQQWTMEEMLDGMAWEVIRRQIFQ
jgi:hypothetical protein